MGKNILPVILLLAGTAHADPQPWMTRENPNELGVYILVDGGCPFSQSEVASLVEGEYRRARVKNVNYILLSELYLSLEVTCGELTIGGKQSGWVVAVSLRFATAKFGPYDVLYQFPTFGTLLSGGLENNAYYTREIKGRVEAALTDYRKANLG